MPEDVLDILLRLSNLQGFVAGTGEAAAGVRRIGTAAKESSAEAAASGKSMSGVAGLANKAFKGTAVAVAAFAYESTKMAVNFDKQMEMVHTQAGASQHEVNQMSKAILDMSASGMYAQGPTQLAEGLFHLESIGLRGTRALNALKIAAQGAAVGNADLESTTTALGSAWLVGIKGAGNLHQTMALLNATVGAGNMRMNDLVDSLGTGVLPAAKLAGLSITDVMGALATLTDEGYHGSSAMAQFATSLHFLTDPTTKAQKALAQLHLGAYQLAQVMRTQGLPAALQLLKSRLNDLGDPTRAGAILGNILPAGRGRVLETLMNQATRVQMKIHQIQSTSRNFADDVAKTHQTASFRIHAAWSQIQADMIHVGHLLEPIAVALAIGLAHIVHWLILMAPGIARLLPYVLPVAAGFLAWKAAIIGVTVATKVMEAAETAALVVMALMEGDVAAAAAEWALLNAIMAVNPFVLIVTALVVLGVALVVAYKKFGWFRNAVHAVFAWLSMAAKTSIGAVVAAFKFMERIAGVVAEFIRQHWRIIIFFVLGPLGLAIDFVTKHWQWFSNAGRNAWRAIAGAASWAWSNVIKPVLHWIVGAANWTGHAIGVAFSAVAKVLSWPFRWAWNNVIKPVANWIVGAFHWVGAEITKVWNKISGPIKAVAGFIGGVGHGAGNIASSVGNFLGLAGGGTIASPGWAWVGEHGPELLNLPQGAQVRPLNSSGTPATAPLGAQFTFVVPVVINGREVARATGKYVDDRLARQ